MSAAATLAAIYVIGALTVAAPIAIRCAIIELNHHHNNGEPK